MDAASVSGWEAAVVRVCAHKQLRSDCAGKQCASMHEVSKKTPTKQSKQPKIVQVNIYTCFSAWHVAGGRGGSIRGGGLEGGARGGRGKLAVLVEEEGIADSRRSRVRRRRSRLRHRRSGTAPRRRQVPLGTWEDIISTSRYFTVIHDPLHDLHVRIRTVSR